MNEHQSMIEELLGLEDGLTDWEVTFIEDLADREHLTYPQAAKVAQIWDERIGGSR